MIIESEITQIVKAMNAGGDVPQGVEPLTIDRGLKVYTRIYFEGLGVYIVHPSNNIIKILTEEESQELKNS